jgi:hypothetical protein
MESQLTKILQKILGRELIDRGIIFLNWEETRYYLCSFAVKLRNVSANKCPRLPSARHQLSSSLLLF